MADELRAIVVRLNPNLPVTPQALEEYSAVGLLPQRIVIGLAGGLGLVGFVLAAIGIYAITAYVVTSRTREFGIRLALGAQRSRVVNMVLSEGLWLALLGSIVALVLATVASRLLAAFLFGASAVDPVVFSVAAESFLVVALAASCVPALRAGLIDPIEALRYE